MSAKIPITVADISTQPTQTMPIRISVIANKSWLNDIIILLIIVMVIL